MIALRFIEGFRPIPGFDREHEPILTQRQAQVLQALVGAYVGFAAPVGSATLAGLLPVRLSSASVRSTLAELDELGLLEQAHRSAGRIPTGLGLRVFVDQLLAPRLGPFEKRDLEDELSGDGVVEAASRLLSERTRQLGFVLSPDGIRRCTGSAATVPARTTTLTVTIDPPLPAASRDRRVSRGRSARYDLTDDRRHRNRSHADRHVDPGDGRSEGGPSRLREPLRDSPRWSSDTPNPP